MRAHALQRECVLYRPMRAHALQREGTRTCAAKRGHTRFQESFKERFKESFKERAHPHALQRLRLWCSLKHLYYILYILKPNQLRFRGLACNGLQRLPGHACHVSCQEEEDTCLRTRVTCPVRRSIHAWHFERLAPHGCDVWP